jgi:hypothetical protein
MTKWENSPSGHADKPVESQHGGQKVFRGLYIKSPWRERRPLPAPASPARPPTPRPNLEIMDERVFLPRWLFSIYMQMQRHAAQRKSTYQCTFRRKNPTQHALFLQHVSGMTFVNHEPTASSDPSVNTQAEFDSFYSCALALLNKFYPEKTVTMTTRDPTSINPEIKYKLRRKNRLMRAGRVEEAGALAERIGKDMKRHSKTQFSKIDSKANVKDMWAAVRKLTGRHQEPAVVEGVTAESLNDHYAAISTDHNYAPPLASILLAPSNPITFLNGKFSNSLITYVQQPQDLMAFQPGSSVWALQSSVNPSLTSSIFP